MRQFQNHFQNRHIRYWYFFRVHIYQGLLYRQFRSPHQRFPFLRLRFSRQILSVRHYIPQDRHCIHSDRPDILYHFRVFQDLHYILSDRPAIFQDRPHNLICHFQILRGISDILQDRFHTEFFRH